MIYCTVLIMAVKVELEVQEEGGETLPQARNGEERERNQPYLYYLGMVVVVIGFASCVMQLQFHDDNCSVDINDGSWVQGKWHSHHCLMHHFDSSELPQCLAKRPHVVLVGGTNMQYYHQKLGEVQAELQHQARPTYKISIDKLGDNGVEVDSLYKKLVTELDSSLPLLVLHRLEKSHFDDDNEKCKSELKHLMAKQEALLEAGKTQAVEVAPLIVTLMSDLSGSCLEIAETFYANSSLSYILLPPSPGEEASDFLSHEEMNMVLNLFCNSPSNATCCVPTLSGTLASYVYLDASFLLLLLALYLGIWLVFATGATFALAPYIEAMACNLEKFFTILHCIGGTCTVLFYMLLADRLDYFTRVNNFSNPLLFALTMVAVLIATGATLKRRKKREYLTEEQVDEWRGWMIIVIIAVNYTAMDEVLWIHLLSRLMVGGFLFLNGYTHFMHFWQAGGVSWKRVLYVLLQLNFIPLCVCLSLGSSYGAYYLVPLLSFNFLLTVFFVAVWPSVNTIKQNQLGPAVIVVTIKFAVAFILISYLLPFAKEPLASGPMRMFLQSFDDCPYAIYHWLYQNRYMTLLGMGVAMIASQLRGDYAAMATQFERPMKFQSSVFSAVFAVCYIFFLVHCKDRDSCVDSQTYFAILPLLAFLHLRNTFNPFRYYYSTFLSQTGSLSVWLFVSHFHLLLARDGKGLLMLIPRFYYLNVLAVATVYVFFFLIVLKSIGTLKAWLREPSKPKTSDTALGV